MYMYIFMYMSIDIAAAPERKDHRERKIKYIVVRNCLSKDMDRRIVSEYRRDADATGVERRRRLSSGGSLVAHRRSVLFTFRSFFFSFSFFSFSLIRSNSCSLP